ncbi:MAG: FlgD immunoglobulin-like domain containing protein [bacterium]
MAILVLVAVVTMVGWFGAPSNALAYGYTITPLGSLTQSWPEIDFTGPYFYFLLRNTAAVADSFHLEIQNLIVSPVPPQGYEWFPQVCLRQICFPDSTTLRFEAGVQDTIGVDLVPFTDGVGNADFVMHSVGNPALNSTFHLRLYAGTAAVGAGMPPSIPTLQLSQSAPNPATGRTRIPFILPREGRATLRVYDAAGRLVETLVDGTLAAGAHSAEWTARTASGQLLPAGAYFYRLETPRGSLSRSLILIR